MEDPLPYDHLNHHPQYRNDVVGSLPLPPLDHTFLPFPDDGDVTTDVNVDFPFNVDFDFSFDDLSFADDLLLEQPDTNSIIDFDPLILSSDISQDRVNPNLNNSENNQTSNDVVADANHEPISSEGSNFGGKCDSPEIGSSKSHSGVCAGNSCDRDGYSFILLIDNNNDNNEGGNHLDLSRKIIKVEHAKNSNQNSSNNSSGSGSGSGSGSINETVSKSKSKSKSNRKKELEHARAAETRTNDSSSGSISETLSKTKRKKEGEHDHAAETRTNKFRRSNVSLNIISSDENVEGAVEGFSVGGGGVDEDEKKKARLVRNRESAQLSRQRKKKYVDELEDKVRSMVSTITDLNGKISYFMTENATLRQQLSGGVASPGVSGFGMYPAHPMAPMPYPWMPCPPAYMVKPQGSHVPLVPIPRLKPQQPTPTPKVKKSSEGKKDKGEGKTKKVASVSLLGLLFFMLLFGGLVPMVNVRYGRVKGGFDGVQSGSVFRVDKHGEGRFGHRRVFEGSNSLNGRNTSEPLVASLYVPRNDELVKIDGNLIIHSVLASEKAKVAQNAGGMKTSEETGLAIHRSYPPYPTPRPGSNNWRHPHLDRNENGRQRALSSADGFTPIGSDGKLQQWFREGLAGPMLSSGMCTEVFQFDVSPTPGSIVPATPISSVTSEDHLNSTRPNKTNNRRILHRHAIPIEDHTLNTTEEDVRPHEQNNGLESNKSRSSVVVSVLVDPREVGDGDGEGVIGSKTLPRIFVVVLIDSVKYVTYSCMLPFLGSGSHLITT